MNLDPKEILADVGRGQLDLGAEAIKICGGGGGIVRCASKCSRCPGLYHEALPLHSLRVWGVSP